MVLLAMIAGALFCLLMMVQLSRAQMLCGPLPDILAGLAKRFGEFPIIRMTGEQGGYVLTRSDSGRWTLVRVIGETGCFVATGRESTVDRGV